jgi:ribonuclease-3
MGVTPTYRVLSESGPDHAKRFVVGVYLNDKIIAEAEGDSKQEAEENSARKALKLKHWED